MERCPEEQRETTCVLKSCLMCEGVYKETRIGQNMCSKREEWRRKEKTSLFFPSMKSKQQNFRFLSCAVGDNFNSLIFLLKNRLWCFRVAGKYCIYPGKFSFLILFQKLGVFLQQQKDRKDQTHLGVQVSCFAAPSPRCTLQAQVTVEGT